MALGVASQNSTDLAALDAFAASVGARPATWTLWSTWGDRGGQYRCFKGHGTCIFPGALARGLRDRGVTPLIYWQPTNPADPGAGRFERYRNTIAGKHDRYIREWARAAKAFGKPVIVRLAHEMNGTWFPWSLTNFDNSPVGSWAAWRHVVRIFRNVGARNVMFLWSPFQRCGTCSSATLRAVLSGQPVCRLRRGLGPQLGGRRVDLPRRPRRRVPGRPAAHHQDRSPPAGQARRSCRRSRPTTSVATRPPGSGTATGRSSGSGKPSGP